MQVDGVLAQLLLDARLSGLDGLGFDCARAHVPPSVPWFGKSERLEQALVRRLELRPVLDGRVPLGDGEAIVGRLGADRVELQQELVGLDAALVVRLLVERRGQRLDDASGELVAARLDEETVHVVGAVLLVLGEDLDQVLQRLGLQLVELLALLRRTFRRRR